jgi:putative restriction endonuclease
MKPATGTPTSPPSANNRPPALHNGDRLTRAEFERRYEAMPQLKKAELIDGVVYMPSPASLDHSEPHFNLIGWLVFYKMATQGIEGGDNGTLRLDMGNEPQPDAYLRILETHAGRAQVDKDRYVTGTPELIAEVARSSVSIDLNAKLDAYRRNGVREYVVWRVEDGAIDWFVLRRGRYRPLPRTPAGLFQSEVLPGLWLDPQALIRGDLMAVFQVVQQGLADPAHAAFVARLQRAASGKTTARRGRRRRGS